MALEVTQAANQRPGVLDVRVDGSGAQEPPVPGTLEGGPEPFVLVSRCGSPRGGGDLRPPTPS
jgi:hypothetical protein